ncbi:MAG: toxin FitB [Kribbellaceae bacterium]|jgi:predicted nucleic acid-binding protein|nr:toxin FitB [Kribbellaceae bacterium]
MIVFDTNVASELMKASPNGAVWSWMLKQPRDSLCTTAITIAEIHYGIERLPTGRRRTLLHEAADETFAQFAAEVLAFDEVAATTYPLVMLGRERAGLPIDSSDAYIASVCRAQQATLATRNTKDFVETGVELVNPWE